MEKYDGDRMCRYVLHKEVILPRAVLNVALNVKENYSEDDAIEWVLAHSDQTKRTTEFYYDDSVL